MFGVRTIEIIDGTWCIADAVESLVSLDEAHNVAVFVPRQGMWREIVIGRVRAWDGELSLLWRPVDLFSVPAVPVHYTGKVVAAVHHVYAYCPAPHLEEGVWAAYDRSTGESWALQPHDIVKTTDCDNGGNVPLQPKGRYVYRAGRYPRAEWDAPPLGLVAFDLGALPFDPAEYEIRDGAYISTKGLVLDIALYETQKLFGKLDLWEAYNGIFWSD